MLSSVGGKKNTWKKPTQTWGECTVSVQILVKLVKLPLTLHNVHNKIKIGSGFMARVKHSATQYAKLQMDQTS